MPKPPALTPAQRDLLVDARHRADRLLTPPPRLRGRARQLVAEKLVALGLAESVAVCSDQPVWQAGSSAGPTGLRLTAAGLALVTKSDDAEASLGTSEVSVLLPGSALIAPAEPAAWTKTARLLALLRQDEGVDLAALGTALDWLPHTVRAALSGLRRKGHVLIREKRESDGASLYRLGSR